LANTNSSIATQATRITLVNTNLTGTNTALRTLISDRLQVANAAATYQTKAVERAALANTNAYIGAQATRITLVNTNLTGTNTALRTLISDRLQVANAVATYQTKAVERAALANTNAYIATKVNTTTFNSALANTNSYIAAQATRITLVNTNLTGTNTAIRALDAQKLSVANATTLLAAKATWSGLTSTNTALRSLISDRMQVANAVAIGATKASWSAVTSTNTALRTLISDRLQVANAAATYLTKNNPVVTGTLTANGSTGTSGYYLRTSGTGVYWSPVAASGATWSALTTTNTALRTLISDRLQVANAASIYQTKAVERAALANTNAYIATKLTSTYASTTAASLTWGATSGQILRNENSEFAFGLYNTTPYALYIQGRNLSNAARDIVLQPLGGNIGIGTTSPAYKLDVNGYVGATRYNLTSTNSTYAYGDGSGWTFGGSGYVYFNQSGTTYSQTRIQARAGISNDQAADLTLYGGTSGYTTITGSARSPIFYDSDNTAYYVNPNSSSNMAQVIADDWFRAVAKTGLYSQTYGHHLYAQAGGQYWAVSSTGSSGGFQFRTAYETGIRGYLYWDGTDNFGLLQSGGGWILRTWNTGVESYGSHRAPIFYDSNDTGYYCDPNGYSSMYEMRLWGNALYIRGSSPTIFFTDTDHQSAMLHNNSNLFYILRGNVDSTGWNTVGSGNWPMVVNLTNNDVTWGGNISAIYNVVAYASDARLKENVQVIPNAIDKIKQIRGVSFDWKNEVEELGFEPETKYNDLGVIAQEIQAVLPQAVKPAPFDQWIPDPSAEYEQEYLDQMMGTSRSGENYLTVQLDKIVPLLIEGIKEQQNQIEKLLNRIKVLEQK
jgi:hypothetical protein